MGDAIGRGSFGEVHKATRHGVHVAVKLLTNVDPNDPDSLNKLTNEVWVSMCTLLHASLHISSRILCFMCTHKPSTIAHTTINKAHQQNPYTYNTTPTTQIIIMHRLRHPHILQLLGVCEAPLALVTELCVGGNLEVLLHKGHQGVGSWKRRVLVALYVAQVWSVCVWVGLWVGVVYVFGVEEMEESKCRALSIHMVDYWGSCFLCCVYQLYMMPSTHVHHTQYT